MLPTILSFVPPTPHTHTPHKKVVDFLIYHVLILNNFNNENDISIWLRWSYYNRTLRQVANLFNKVILCVERHATMLVQVYANPFIGEWIMNIKKWEVRRNVHCMCHGVCVFVTELSYNEIWLTPLFYYVLHSWYFILPLLFNKECALQE